MRNLGGEAFVVHEEKVDLLGIGDQELLEAVGEEVPGLYEWSDGCTQHGTSLADLLVAAVANLHPTNAKSTQSKHPIVGSTHLWHG